MAPFPNKWLPFSSKWLPYAANFKKWLPYAVYPYSKMCELCELCELFVKTAQRFFQKLSALSSRTAHS